MTTEARARARELVIEAMEPIIYNTSGNVIDRLTDLVASLTRPSTHTGRTPADYPPASHLPNCKEATCLGCGIGQVIERTDIVPKTYDAAIRATAPTPGSTTGGDVGGVLDHVLGPLKAENARLRTKLAVAQREAREARERATRLRALLEHAVDNESAIVEVATRSSTPEGATVPREYHRELMRQWISNVRRALSPVPAAEAK